MPEIQRCADREWGRISFDFIELIGIRDRSLLVAGKGMEGICGGIEDLFTYREGGRKMTHVLRKEHQNDLR